MKLKFFELAKQISFKSPSKFKLGCVITNKHRIISVGYNQMHKTHPKLNTYGNFIHAELHALIGLSYKDTRGAVCYVYREDTHQKMASSKPCPVCHAALIQAGIKEIYYTTRDGYKNEKI